MFEEVKLFTRDGGYITTVGYPKMQPKAEVIFWGMRKFAYHGRSSQYRELTGMTTEEVQEWRNKDVSMIKCEMLEFNDMEREYMDMLIRENEKMKQRAYNTLGVRIEDVGTYEGRKIK